MREWCKYLRRVPCHLRSRVFANERPTVASIFNVYGDSGECSRHAPAQPTGKRRAKSRRAQRDVRAYVHTYVATNGRNVDRSLRLRVAEYTRVHRAYIRAYVCMYVCTCVRTCERACVRLPVSLPVCAAFRGCARRGAARATNSGVSSPLPPTTSRRRSFFHRIRSPCYRNASPSARESHASG